MKGLKKDGHKTSWAHGFLYVFRDAGIGGAANPVYLLLNKYWFRHVKITET
tara:strand:- start:873 stop:1025 length:153 start_codon:yes stop_codon:yes gene_type:complete